MFKVLWNKFKAMFHGNNNAIKTMENTVNDVQSLFDETNHAFDSAVCHIHSNRKRGGNPSVRHNGTTRRNYPKTTTRKSTVHRGCVVRTVDGGILNFKTQNEAAESLSALYDVTLYRHDIYNALNRHKGKLFANGIVIATVTYKENK